MSITPVSGNSNININPMKENNAIKLLEKQKMQLQEQIQQTNESKLDDKAKQERIKQLQDQIQQIDMEIQQIRIEKLNKSQNTSPKAEKDQSNKIDNTNSSNSGGMPQLIQADLTYSQAKMMNSIKKDLGSQRKVLEKEISLDESRGGTSKAKRTELQQIEAKERNLHKKVGEALGTVQDQVKEASEKESTKNKEQNDNEENSQKEVVKGADVNYRRVDIKI